MGICSSLSLLPIKCKDKRVNSQTCSTYKTASITGNANTGNQTYNITGDCYDKITINQTAAYNAGVASVTANKVRYKDIAYSTTKYLGGNTNGNIDISVSANSCPGYANLTKNNFALIAAKSYTSASSVNSTTGAGVNLSWSIASYTASTATLVVRMNVNMAMFSSNNAIVSFTVRCFY